MRDVSDAVPRSCVDSSHARPHSEDMPNGLNGLKKTFPYEDTSPGVARYQCEECGAWERSDKSDGRLAHSKRCDSRPQPETAQRAIALEDRKAELRKFASQVRRTGMSHGRDADVREAVRLGYLRESDAMNLDD